ncbi:MAG: hypothetical protein V2J51_14055 [Erythrobacter sp.]|jgi:hypothetical protein|nr:hypothetical protein [Erythrobacter sp.]
MPARSHEPWPIRSLIMALLFGALSALAAFDAFATHYFERVSTLSAPATLLDDPGLRVQRSERLAGVPGADMPAPDDIAFTAREALRSDPLNPVAIRQLGGIAGFRPGATRKPERLRLAEAVTRRDRVAQLDLATTALQAADIPQAMVHFDRLFTVSEREAVAIMPQLVALLDLPQARVLFADLEGRRWLATFLSVAIDQAPAIARVGDLVLALDDPAGTLLPDDLAKLTGRLAFEGELAASQRLASQSGLALAGLTTFAPRAGNVSNATAPLTWRLAEEPRAFAQLGEDGAVEVDLYGDTQVDVLERVTALDAGSYALATDISVSDDAELLWRWQVACRRTGAWEMLREAEWTELDDGPAPMRLVLPQTGCAVQRWVLQLQADTRGPSGAMARIRLELNEVEP